MDKNNEFYKSVCEKYIDTMSKEMIIKSDKKILHIIIDDEYIKLKNEGKINISNYFKYLDDNYSGVEEYDSYKEIYDCFIKDNIICDLQDLELIDENGNWMFYITFDELRQMGYGFAIKNEYPLLKKYILSEDEIFEFFNCFSLEQLDNFEETLYLYYEIDDIDYNEKNMELYSKSNSDYNSNIIYLSEGMLSYEDFMSDYTNDFQNYYDLSHSKVNEYFKENQIENLMNYGSDTDEGLFHLSSMYQEIMDRLDVKYSDISTEDISDGKYITTITFENQTTIKLDTSAWNGIEIVTENIKSIYEKFENIKEKNKNSESKNAKEYDYDFN